LDRGRKTQEMLRKMANLFAALESKIS
jgi:hypothetical protein